MSTTYLAGLAAPLVAFGVVFAGGIIGLLYGAQYEPATFAFACCLAAGAGGVLSQGASSYLLGSDRQRTLMIVVLAGSLVKVRSEEHTSELQSLMRTSYGDFCLKKKQTPI